MGQASNFSNLQAINPNIAAYHREGGLETPKGPERYDAPVSFIGKLEHHQEKFMRKHGDQKRGFIIGPAGCGKKVTALYQIAQKKVPALIIVHDESRLREWLERIPSVLKIHGDEKGSIEDGFYQFGDIITVVISHCVRENADRIPDDIEMVVVDECQKADLKIVLVALVALRPTFIFGLTRDPRRNDGMGKTMTESIGPILCHIESTIDYWQSSSGGVLKSRNTEFQYADPNNYDVMVDHLYLDKKRNSIIVQDVLHEVAVNEGKVLIISESINHLMELNRLLVEAHQTTGIMSETATQSDCGLLITQFMNRKIQILLTTYQTLSTPYVFNCQALVLASPRPYGFSLMDATAPLMGPDNFNPPVIYDYIDEPAVLKALYAQRLKKYARLGISKKISSDFVH